MPHMYAKADFIGHRYEVNCRPVPLHNLLACVWMSCNESVNGVHVRHAYRLPLEFAHPSVHGILQWLDVREDGGFDVKNEPNRYSVEMVLPIAHLLAIEVLRVQIEHFNLDANEPVFQQCLRDFEEAWPRRTT